MDKKFLEVSQIKGRSKQEQKRISSREVAPMMEIEHSKLLRKIDGINEDFRKAKIGFSKYWIENTYKVEGQTRNSWKRKMWIYQMKVLGCGKRLRIIKL